MATTIGSMLNVKHIQKSEFPKKKKDPTSSTMRADKESHSANRPRHET